MVPAAYTVFDASPAGSSLSFGTGANAQPNTLSAGNGSTNASGRLEISSERPLARVEFTRAVTSVAAMAPGTQGVAFTRLDYASTGATDPFYTTDRTTPVNVPAAEGVLANDTDIDGDSLAVTAVDGAAYTPGTQLAIGSGALVTIAADGAISYNPNGALNAVIVTTTDSFTYDVTAGGETVSATVTFTIVPDTNNAPVATDDAFTVTDGRTVTIQPLGNDSDPDGPLPSSGAVVALFDGATRIDVGPAGTPYGTAITLSSGTAITVLADGRMEVTAPTGASGDESLGYLLSDGTLSDRGEITLTRAAEAAPVVDLNGPPPPALAGLAGTSAPIVTAVALDKWRCSTTPAPSTPGHRLASFRWRCEQPCRPAPRTRSPGQ